LVKISNWLKKTQFWFEAYGNQKATVLGKWFGVFFNKNWKRRGIKNLSRKVHETGLLESSYRRWQTTHIPQLCGAAWLMVQLTNLQHTCELVFKPMVGHFEHMLWLSICFLCTRWTSCFTPCLIQQVLF